MRAAYLTIVAVVLASAALVLLGWPLSAYRDADFVGFWAASSMVLAGADPYDPVAWRATIAHIGSQGLALNVPGVGYGYPLTTALMFEPFALIPIAIAAPLWLVIQIVLAGAALVFLARTLFPRTVLRDRPVLLALAAASQPAWVLAASGNVGGFLLAIAASASALLVRRHALAAGAVAGLLVMKPHPLLVAMFLIVVALPRREAVRAAAGAAVTGGLIMLVTLALRPEWPGEFVVSVRGLADAPVVRASLFSALASYGAVAWAVAATLVAAALAWQIWARPPLATVIAVAIPLSLIVSPYIWSYDHIVLLIPVAVVIASAAEASPTVRAEVLVALAVALVLIPWVLYAVAFKRGDEAWSVAVPVLTLVLIAFARLAIPVQVREASR